MKTNTLSLAPKINYIRHAILSATILLSINVLGQNVYSILTERWSNENWQKSEQKINTYDGSNYLKHTISYTWITPPGFWQNASQFDYTNNPDGTAFQSVYQIWDSENSLWVNTFRDTYTYNASQKLLTTTIETWNGFWQKYTRDVNTYDDNVYLIQTLNQEWESILGIWKNTGKTDYSNNPSGTVNQSITQVLNASNMWENNFRETYTYTGANKVLTATYEYWSGTTWVNFAKLTNTYNTSGYVSIGLFQNWSGLDSAWKDSRRHLYTYNGSNNLAQIVQQNWDNNNWSNFQRLTYGYSLGTEDFSLEKNLMLYPNPATDKITVKTKEYLDDTSYFITDQTGRIVKKGLLNDAETTIDISQMARGLYFFRIDDNYKTSVKLIKN